jgi:hypothetical protein
MRRRKALSLAIPRTRRIRTISSFIVGVARLTPQLTWFSMTDLSLRDAGAERCCPRRFHEPGGSRKRPLSSWVSRGECREALGWLTTKAPPGATLSGGCLGLERSGALD